MGSSGPSISSSGSVSPLSVSLSKVSSSCMGAPLQLAPEKTQALAGAWVFDGSACRYTVRRDRTESGLDQTGCRHPSCAHFMVVSGCSKLRKETEVFHAVTHS